MAVKMRLKRMGKKKQPTYRVVVADSRAPRDGRIIELLGRYDPRQEPSLVEIDNERAQYWLSTGAQPTDRVRKLLEISGAVARAKVSRSGVYRLEDDAPPPAAEESPPESPESQENQEEQESREIPQATGEEAPEAGPDAQEAPVADQAPADGPDQAPDPAPSPAAESAEPATGMQEERAETGTQAETTQEEPQEQAETEKQEVTQ